jgi:MarR-like DNA-binding transcriptional regulator SgrR of sgrS sRNA
MYKSLSEAMQERQRRNIEFSHSNTGGIDDTVWARNVRQQIDIGVSDDPEDERVRLLALKIEFQNKARKLTETIALAERQFHRNGQRAKEYDHWHQKRSIYLDSLSEIDQKLAAIKLKVKRKSEEKELARQQTQRESKQQLPDDCQSETLADVFMEMAKEMLADPVYQRVLIAAVHRLRERHGQ